MRYDDLISKLGTEEKISLVTGSGFWHTRGIPRLDIPSLYVTDGPHGVRKLADTNNSSDVFGAVPTTAFPTASLVASSFDPELVEEMGRALGRESRLHGVSMLLGPGANIKRSPLCGRNFEYFSEDPLLSSRLAAAWIRGLESTGVAASLKHFAVNNQESRRMTLDAVVDDRTLREIYLASFEEAVREGRPTSVMAAYNRVNGVYCTESRFLLEQVLRKEWGFEGLVVTDWGATADRVEGLRSGVDLEMPEGGRGSASGIRAALSAGTLKIAALDRAVDRILGFVLGDHGGRLGTDREQPVPVAKQVVAEVSERDAETLVAENHELARRIAVESMVLLKNEGGILPLDRSAGPIGVVGELASSSRYQGAGSSSIRPTRLVSLLDALAEERIACEFEAGYRLGDVTPARELEDAAVALARRIGAAGGTLIYAIGLPPILESEGFDRDDLELPANQIALFEKLEAACPRVVAVWSGGSPVATDWLHHVRALLAAYLGGQAAGAAVRDLLFGIANPSGKLAESWPLRLEDTPAYGNFGGQTDRVLYKEGIFIGYRWYASSGRPVRFPFGHGLSYTTFFYSDLVLDRRKVEAPDLEQGAKARLSFTLANVGRRPGREIAQLYLSFPESAIERPVVALAAWRKIPLDAGESVRVDFDVDFRALRYWDSDAGAFRIEEGPVVLRVGPSSAEMPLEAVLHIERGSSPTQRGPRVELGGHPSSMTDAEFGGRLSSPIAAPRPGLPFHLGSPLGDMASRSPIMRLVRTIMVAVQVRGSGTRKGEANRRMIEEMIDSMPLGRFGPMSGDRLGRNFLEALVEVANSHPLRALGRLLGRGGKRSD